MKVHDLVVIFDIETNKQVQHVWEIQSICLGSTTSEDLIELKSMNFSPGIDVNGVIHNTTWVPLNLLSGNNIQIYTVT